MPAPNPKNQNKRNLFLNEYFQAIVVGILILFLVLAYLVILGPKFQSTQVAIQENLAEEQRLYNDSQRKLDNLKAILDLYKKINPADLAKFNGVLPDTYVRERLFGELEEIVGQGGWLVKEINISQPEEKTVAAPVAAPASDSMDSTDTSAPAAPTPSPTATAPSAPSNKIGSVTVVLTVNAIDYPGLKNLLHILENNLRLFDVTGVSFNPSGNSAVINLTTYYYQAQ